MRYTCGARGREVCKGTTRGCSSSYMVLLTDLLASSAINFEENSNEAKVHPELASDEESMAVIATTGSAVGAATAFWGHGDQILHLIVHL